MCLSYDNFKLWEGILKLAQPSLQKLCFFLNFTVCCRRVVSYKHPTPAAQLLKQKGFCFWLPSFRKHFLNISCLALNNSSRTATDPRSSNWTWRLTWPWLCTLLPSLLFTESKFDFLQNGIFISFNLYRIIREKALHCLDGFPLSITL